MTETCVTLQWLVLTWYLMLVNADWAAFYLCPVPSLLDTHRYINFTLDLPTSTSSPSHCPVCQLAPLFISQLPPGSTQAPSPSLTLLWPTPSHQPCSCLSLPELFSKESVVLFSFSPSAHILHPCIKIWSHHSLAKSKWKHHWCFSMGNKRIQVPRLGIPGLYNLRTAYFTNWPCCSVWVVGSPTQSPSLPANQLCCLFPLTYETPGTCARLFCNH